MTTPLPLDGMLVLDFSQFLAGPMAAMRLGDLGARVIKVERPQGGDIGRRLAFAGVVEDGDTLSFHITNRNKESYAADLKNEADRDGLRALVARADVIVQNFRPGIMERLGFGYDAVSAINPGIIYASVSGYGTEGPWKDRPGQDLLAQSLSGLPWLNGSSDDPPVPVGIALADVIASIHLASGITAALLRRERTGLGGRVDTSLLESMLDLQFELISAHLGDPSITVKRGARNTAHAFLQAPYGVYPTSDGYLAIAMTPVPALGALIGLATLEQYVDPDTWWTEQTAITRALADHLATRSTEHWLEILDAADVWCAPVLTLPELVAHDGFRALDMAQQIERPDADGGPPVAIQTTRSPVRYDGRVLKNDRGAPRLGEHTDAIRAEFADEEAAV
ncbi:CaiB/BaiF CoA transferase family protein [Lacisediminihabitans profunda]|uniref:CoA transferase n=1 Tax=Lacisediminihabitans profunda TaxID=2594790 RepID=A0A5C8UQU9_9MICO|nr:CaiB/BaiF CoA-transferase family protein [Lacisediminihabitans profunda]TXN30964.1 CoA transferase [Lacisediminihabitans profunda]